MYNATHIPMLVIVGPDGGVIRQDGVEQVANDPDGVKYPWFPSSQRKAECEAALADTRAADAEGRCPCLPACLLGALEDAAVAGAFGSYIQ